MIQTINNKGKTLAVIIRNSFCEPGIHFATPDAFSQQLAYMQHATGKIISPHVHNPVHRDVHLTQEVLIIRAGRLRVDIYDGEKRYLESTELGKGDVILLADGGHGFEVLENVEMIEVKQGPYVGEMDKTRFAPVPSEKILIKN